MTLLTALGLASVAFVAFFTARAYRDNTAGNGQSRWFNARIHALATRMATPKL